MKTTVVHNNIEHALRSERPLRKAPVGFSGRVIDALPAGRPGTAVEPLAKPARVWLRLAWAAAFSALTLLVWVQVSSSRVDEPLTKQNQPAPPRSIDLRFPSVTVEQFQALSTKIDQPLEKELERVLADTRNAIQFVAANFMPGEN